jgi:hypothetical protein
MSENNVLKIGLLGGRSLEEHRKPRPCSLGNLYAQGRCERLGLGGQSSTNKERRSLNSALPRAFDSLPPSLAAVWPAFILGSVANRP